MNQEKIRHAAAATDVVLEGCNTALGALQGPLWTNGAGVLTDPSMVRSNLHRARDAIDMALHAMNSLDGWPREQDYECSLCCKLPPINTPELQKLAEHISPALRAAIDKALR